MRDHRGLPTRLRFRGVPILARVRGAGGPREHRFYEIGWLSPEWMLLAAAAGIGVFSIRWIAPSWPMVPILVSQLVGLALMAWGFVAAGSWLMVLRGGEAATLRIFAKRDAQRCCRSCGFELRGLSPESDGCTVCPECGAAWRLERDDLPSSDG